MRFTYPFCYTPHPLLVKDAESLIKSIDNDEHLSSVFHEGKMLGILMVEQQDGSIAFLHGFSGLAGGKACIEGFVEPIYDLSVPGGYFRTREAEISATQDAEQKKQMSQELQQWLFSQYLVLNAKGEERSILEIFAQEGLTPPGGTGDCAAPKLLNYAFRHGMKPLAMGEFWYGQSPASEVRSHGCFYPSCTGKCGPLLKFMLQGLDVEDNPLEKELAVACESEGLLTRDLIAEDGSLSYGILYEDDSIIVADKPGGMLSVPGRTGAKSLLELLSERCGQDVFSCHRLDMDTTGVIVYAKDLKTKTELEKQFSSRNVKKTYLAQLCASTKAFEGPSSGTISLPLMVDWYDRPRQMVDREHGKPAHTKFEILKKYDNGELLVRFMPLTGRTHQLRVHAAHIQGLGRPIKGDRLYGGGTDCPLQLVASSIEFTHPINGKIMVFNSKMCTFTSNTNE